MKYKILYWTGAHYGFGDIINNLSQLNEYAQLVQQDFVLSFVLPKTNESFANFLFKRVVDIYNLLELHSNFKLDCDKNHVIYSDVFWFDIQTKYDTKYEFFCVPKQLIFGKKMDELLLEAIYTILGHNVSRELYNHIQTDITLSSLKNYTKILWYDDIVLFCKEHGIALESILNFKLKPVKYAPTKIKPNNKTSQKISTQFELPSYRGLTNYDTFQIVQHIEHLGFEISQPSLFHGPLLYGRENLNDDSIRNTSYNQRMLNESFETIVHRMSKCKLHVGYESGLAHLAHSLGIPCIIIHQPYMKSLSTNRGSISNYIQLVHSLTKTAFMTVKEILETVKYEDFIQNIDSQLYNNVFTTDTRFLHDASLFDYSVKKILFTAVRDLGKEYVNHSNERLLSNLSYMIAPNDYDLKKQFYNLRYNMERKYD